jgi:hypothetical protein
MAPCSGRAKGARKTHFSRLSKISCFYHAVCGNDSVRPATEGHPSAAGKGGIAINWGSNPQPSTRVNEQ